jgi:predicted Ser/Thr protein kinase
LNNTTIFKKPRNKTKADVYLEVLNNKKVVVKDYSRRNLFVRVFYGRFTLKKEAKAYERLSGVTGIPHFYGFRGKNAIITEHIPSRTLGQLNRGKVPENIFDKLDRIIAEVHSKGIAICDLHRTNILLTDADDVYIIDFAHATTCSPGRPSRITALMMQLDLHAAARIRARYLNLNAPVPEGFFGVIYNTGKFFKWFLRKIKIR